MNGKPGVRSIAVLLFALLVLGPTAATADDSLDIPVRGYGISLGNSSRFTGLRLNFSDRGVERINGITASIWVPGSNPNSEFNGISLGLLGIKGDRFNGITVAGIGMATGDIHGAAAALIGIGAADVTGIAVGGLGLGVENLTGVAIGGLGVGAESIRGVALGLIGVGAGKRFDGFGFAGLGMGGEEFNGVFLAGLGLGGTDMTGLFIAGLGMGGDNLTGVFASLLGMGGEHLKGIFVTGIGMGGQVIEGITVAGFGQGADYFRGAHFSLVHILAKQELKGVAVSAYNRARHRQRGLTIGIINYAYDLQGVQIGLINIVKTNPRGLKVLPLVNAHF